jgi:DNA polymerase elongation subunit (family B)
LGFSNAKFGTVNGHIGVCAHARDAFLKAARLAEDEGFDVIHGIFDVLRLKKKDTTQDEYNDLCQVITDKIGVQINFEGHYKWVAFVSSKLHPRVSILNHYFGVMDNGKVKVRGFEVRPSDTPKFIFDGQTEMINTLASANNSAELYQQIPHEFRVLKTYRQRLLNGQVPISDLIVSKHMSKQPKNYRQKVSQVIVAQQLGTKGVDVKAGSNAKSLFTNAEYKRFKRGAKAVQLIEKGVNPDTKKYLLMLYASVANLLSFSGLHNADSLRSC